MENKDIIVTTVPKVIINLFKEKDDSFIDLISGNTERLCGHKPDKEIIRLYLETFYRLLTKPAISGNDTISATTSPVPRKTESQKKYSKRGGPKTLAEILEVLDLVYQQKMKLTQAYKTVANQRNIAPETVRDKCERRMGWNAEELRRMIENPEEFKRNLKNKFPAKNKEIEEFFGRL